MITETDKAYAAGIIDGEGCIGICWRFQSKRSKNETYSVKVAVGMVDEDVVLWLSAIFGGHVDNSSRSKEYLRTHPKHRILFRWTLHCQKAADFLELILPFLKLKHARAEAAIKLARMSRRRGAQKGHEGMHEMSEQELAQRRPLADFIRGENLRSNPRIVSVAKWGVSA